MNLAAIDLNLLVAFDAVMTERNVTRAGRRLGLSQSAVSNALSRLRHLLADELFVRGADGMRPTPRALELALPVRHALQQLQSALDPAEFSPADATRAFHFAMTDYSASLILPRLAKRLEDTAPGIDIRIRPNTGVNAPPLLDSGEIEFAIGGDVDRAERFASEVLFEDSFVCAMRRGHPLARERVTLDRFVAAKHLLITLTGDPTGFVDRILERKGLKRRVAMTVNQFTVALLIIQNSDMVITLARRMADRYVKFNNLHIALLPFAAPPSKTALVWHRRLGNRPALEWMRAVLVEICRKL